MKNNENSNIRDTEVFATLIKPPIHELNQHICTKPSWMPWKKIHYRVWYILRSVSLIQLKFLLEKKKTFNTTKALMMSYKRVKFKTKHNSTLSLLEYRLLLVHPSFTPTLPFLYQHGSLIHTLLCSTGMMLFYILQYYHFTPRCLLTATPHYCYLCFHYTPLPWTSTSSSTPLRASCLHLMQ